MHRNVYGKALKPCCDSQITGFMRTGYCEVPEQDLGNHSVCVEVTEEFLEYTRDQGNDLSTPQPEYGFKGLKPGDRWCVCAARWQEAMDAGYAPPVILESTHEAALDVIEFADLEKHELRRVEQE